MRTDRAARAVLKALIAALLTGFALFFVLPMVWLVLAATKTPAGLIQDAPLSPGSLAALLDNWRNLMSFQDGAVATWMGNSVLYAALSVILTLLVSVPAGYALALMSFKGRRLLLVVTLVVMLMPATALVLPIFLEFSYMGLVNTTASVVLPMSFFPFGVYLTYIYFSTSVPAELLDSARLDGCGEAATFARVALPLAKPVVALVGFFSFVQNWNNFFLPYVMLPSSGNYPMQVGLTQMLAATPTFNPVVGANAEVQPPELVLATLLSITPVLLVFLFSQRFLVAGLTAGATKG
ncbi:MULTISPECIES: carbohydrate ABC transporter permease [unclassified Nonomuraea]|uniref:carbohydrate ABC transporter permease n=1 Tax=unclassified Nonomuraea TaxID=2593643 RepID=UPI0035C1F344